MRLRRGMGTFLLLAIWLTALWPRPLAVLAAEPPSSSSAASDPQRDSQSRYALGQMYEQAGDLTQAEQYYREALELWPDNQEARTALQRLIDARTPQAPTPPFWVRWFSWLPGISDGTAATTIFQMIGWIVAIILFILLFFKFGLETVRVAFLRWRGVPLLGLGDFMDPTGRLPGLAHQLATNMNDAGLTFYDEKGAILPDFNFIGDSGITEARLLAKTLEMLYTRAVQRINVTISMDDGALNASVCLVDSGNGYVRYLHVVTVDPSQYGPGGELTKVVAQLVADAILISISRDPNTRGLLYQRMGDWTNALKEFTVAAEAAKKQGQCGTYYQAHLNLGNLYSFLGLQDKSVAAYQDVAEKATNPTTHALIQAAMACSYRNWANASPPDQAGTYEWLARQSLDQALGATRKTPLIAYTIACYFSLSGQIDECLRWLREAVSGDLGYLDYVPTDPDMENLMKWLNGRSPGEAIGLRV